MCARICSRERQQRARARQLAFETVGQQREARTDIADKLRMREEHLFDRGRQIAHMQNRRSAGAHQKGRLFDGIVPDRDDQIGALDRIMHIVALRQRRGAHVELGSAGDGAFAHLRTEERDLQTPTKSDKASAQARPARRLHRA